jgi:hypothetical protein
VSAIGRTGRAAETDVIIAQAMAQPAARMAAGSEPCFFRR